MIPIVRIGTGRRKIGVESVTVERSIEQIAARARVDTFTEDRGTIAEQLEIDIRGTERGAKARRLFTGVVETYPGTPEQGFTIAGRSLTRGLIVNDAIGRELFRRQALSAIGRSMALPLGVDVIASAEAQVARYKLEKGTSLGTALQEVAKAHGVVVTDTVDGALRFYQSPVKPVALETWQLGRGDVLDITTSPDVSEWRDEVIVRGWRFPVSSDVADVSLGQLGADIVAGAIQPSRMVMASKAANTRGRAGLQAATEAARRLGLSYPVAVTLRTTERDTGDVVRVRRGSLNRLMIIRSLTYTLTKSQMLVTAACVLPEVYRVTAAFDQSLIQAVRG